MMQAKSDYLLERKDVQRHAMRNKGAATLSCYVVASGDRRYTLSSIPASQCKPSVMYRVRVKLNKAGRKALWNTWQQGVDA
jgi:hypothetical protein